MFYQGNDTRVARNAGLGIGLTLAKSLVEMHGGRIAIASEGVDRGSVATVRLPIAPTAEDPVPQRARIRPENVGGHRVLIVDDNSDAADTLSMVVRTLGENEVRTEFSGAAALDAVPEFRPDIVLLDLKMPGMDGYEVARRIRATPWGRHLLLVALTGLGQEEHKRRSKEAGFDHHLTKPADRAALEAVLGERGPAARVAS
jgi:CheY-like chemotaxis protein